MVSQPRAVKMKSRSYSNQFRLHHSIQHTFNKRCIDRGSKTIKYDILARAVSYAVSLIESISSPNHTTFPYIGLLVVFLDISTSSETSSLSRGEVTYRSHNAQHMNGPII